MDGDLSSNPSLMSVMIESSSQVQQDRFEDSQIDMSVAMLYQVIDRVIIRETRYATDDALEGLLDIAHDPTLTPVVSMSNHVYRSSTSSSCMVIFYVTIQL
ncbi:hypothetical protein K492DRAFT_189176 [Lichtheimia hyalospora FSU 10163]|nr:hypothetical protein K492DRAFT_189176 [Lichtheimia hyalospora FSU 10163]